MTERNDFDPGPDLALGDVLREHLTAPDDGAFTARVMERVRLEPRDNSWEVLAHWLRPGLVAAATLAFAMALGLYAFGGANQGSPPTSGTVASSPADILTTPEPLSDEQILTVVLESGIRQDAGGPND